MSVFLTGKFIDLHHFRIVLSDTLNFLPIARKLSFFINFFKSSREGRSDTLCDLEEHS